MGDSYAMIYGNDDGRAVVVDFSFEVLRGFLGFIDRWNRVRGADAPVMITPPYCDSQGEWHAVVRDSRGTWNLDYTNDQWDADDSVCLGPKD